MKKEYELKLQITDKTLEIFPGKLIDAEKLIRLNPLWTVLSFKQDGDTFQAELKDYSSEREFILNGSFVSGTPAMLNVEFTEGDYNFLSITPVKDNYLATVVYTDPEFEEESELERHTVMWLRGIQEYLRLYQKKTINTVLFRYIMNRIVLTMTPSQRKICLMLLRLTVVEVVVILIIVIGYVFFVLNRN
ncbi:hypothetical protein [Desulfopila sp. IMCC35008]|uniref:hypothetical protein n=1 Tax=Desulfopila sp. IMCC35008 TaxID=2653858 RepID=UPI0013D02A62|nr:hypothetical protein [Desulfopila sp. IMCC35008]